jgi:hypothetical protein
MTLKSIIAKCRTLIVSRGGDEPEEGATGTREA